MKYLLFQLKLNYNMKHTRILKYWLMVNRVNLEFLVSNIILIIV